MSAANNLPLAIHRALEQGFFEVPDPGASGTISWANQGYAICKVVTATAESRALELASAFPVGTRLLVILKTDGGNLTITGASTSVVLDDSGDYTEFVVTDVAGTYQWRASTPPGGGGVPLVLLTGSGAAPAASGLLISGGTTAAPNTTAVASSNFIELRCQSTATSGDNRLAYFRYELASTGGGECLRAFTKLAATVGTARGAHISLDIDESPAGQITGLGAGVDAQILIGDGALASGTFAVVNAEVFSAGTSSDPGGNPISYFRAVNGGNAKVGS